MRRRWLDLAETVLALLGVATFLVMPHGFGADGLVRLETTRQLVAGHISSDRYSIVQSILAVPFYLVGQAFGRPGTAVLLFNSIVFIASLAAIVVLLRDRVAGAVVRRLVLLLLTASMFGNHAQSFFGEVLTAVTVALGFLCLILERTTVGYALLVLGVVNTPAAVPALFLALCAGARPPHRLWKALWPAALCAGLVMLEFYVRHGDPLRTGYEGDHGIKTMLPYSDLPGFSYPLVLGVLSLLFSFGKGLAFYVPGLWLLFISPVAPIPDVLRSFQRYSSWFVAGLVIVYAKWWSWHGGFFWGPRFLVFACIPASVALAIHLSDERAAAKAKVVTLVILAWSLWVGFDGIVLGQWWGLDICYANQAQLESLCWYVPEFSALFRPFIVPPPLTKRAAVALAYYLAIACVLMAPFTLDLIRIGRDRLRRHLGGAAGAN
jgi:hypothetical protein